MATDYAESAVIIGKHFPSLAQEWDKPNNPKTVMSFKNAPIGARFKYPNVEGIWVKINSCPKGRFHDGLGLIVKWNGNKEANQSICHFVDENAGIDFDTEIELI
jgi:hypothetical protein